MYDLCNNPSEWIEPQTFIPERFQKDSPYFLTPSGGRRNPYSFSPFLGGSRICIGKTFVEVVSKLTLPTLLSLFVFELPEGQTKESFEYPHNNMTASFAKKCMLRISHRENLYYKVPAKN